MTCHFRAASARRFSQKEGDCGICASDSVARKLPTGKSQQSTWGKTLPWEPRRVRNDLAAFGPWHSGRIVIRRDRQTIQVNAWGTEPDSFQQRRSLEVPIAKSSAMSSASRHRTARPNDEGTFQEQGKEIRIREWSSFAEEVRRT